MRFFSHPVTVAVSYVLYFLLVQALAAAIAIPLKAFYNDKIIMMIVASCLSSILTILIFIKCKFCSQPSIEFVRQAKPSLWALIAITSLAALLPSMFLQELIPEQLVPNTVEALAEMLSSVWGYLAVAVLAPIAEEVVFRGAALRHMLKAGTLSPWTAIVISAIIFGLSHLNPAQFPHAFLTGILLGWLYYRTGSIVPGILYHWVNNSTAFIIEQWLPGDDSKLEDMIQADNLLYSSVAVSAAMLVIAIWQLNKRLTKD